MTDLRKRDLVLHSAIEEKVKISINPYPATVDKMASSYQC